MKIGFDISQTGITKAGCGYFADTLIRNLLKIDSDNEYLLYSVFGISFWDPEHSKNISRINKSNCTHLLDKLSYEESIALWSGSTAVNEKKLGEPDIIHANNFSCPKFTKARVVYTLYDLSFLDYPEFTSEENRWKCFNGVFDAALRADLIIAISNYSKQRFLQLFPHFPVERIRVVYLGSRFEEPITEKPFSNLNQNNFWLCVGTLEPRKNLRRTLRAYKHHLDIHLDPKPLVLAGAQGWLEDDIDQFIMNLGLTEYVCKLGYVDDPTLKWLYQNCWAFIYPSIYEGFGLPVLEAMNLGAAIITSNTTSLPEVGGDAVLYVNPIDEIDLTKAFGKMMDEQFRNSLKVNGRKRAENFSWVKNATQVLQSYHDVIKMPPRMYKNS